MTSGATLAVAPGYAINVVRYYLGASSAVQIAHPADASGRDPAPVIIIGDQGVAPQTAAALDLHQVEFREGLAEELPIDDEAADVVISNGVLNLVADKQRAFAEIFRVLRSGDTLQFADIANGRPVPEEALRDIDLWTA